MRRYILKVEDVYNELIEWLNDGNGEKIIEIGVYNDYVKSASLFPNSIAIELSDKTFYVYQDDLKNLRIDEKYNMLIFSI